ncbi:MAG TPA: PfkB family carbohydrate kinase [Solirubrobacterales bacterium]|nr:PfkB family carbohydrate kinase [Solirubrobacterales bacterium]
MIMHTSVRPRVAIFSPNPMVSVAIESFSADGGDDIHVHPAGQGVWVARMAAELGAEPVLCGFIGGEAGAVLRPLLEEMPIDLRLVETTEASGIYIHDRRSGEREPVAQSAALPASRHEVDDLFSVTVAAALDCDLLAVCGPYPDNTVPLEIYGSLVADVKANGVPVIVDLSSPRLDSALEGKPDLVKINDWQIAGFVSGPVDTEERMRAAMERLTEAGAGAAIVTRAGDPAIAMRDGSFWELTPPKFEHGAREGCGDSMMGALAATIAAGRDWEDVLRLSAAAGATNFLRAGLGTGSQTVIEELAPRVQLRELG